MKENSPWPSFALSAKVVSDRGCDAQVVWDEADQIMICHKRPFRSSAHGPLWSEEHPRSNSSCLCTLGCALGPYFLLVPGSPATSSSGRSQQRFTPSLTDSPAFRCTSQLLFGWSLSTFSVVGTSGIKIVHW